MLKTQTHIVGFYPQTQKFRDTLDHSAKIFLQFPFVGGFLSDSVSYVAPQCQKCPIGAFVSLEKQPGKRHKHCRACPRGMLRTD